MINTNDYAGFRGDNIYLVHDESNDSLHHTKVISLEIKITIRIRNVESRV